MLSSFLITFRETLEVALVVGIVLSYLVRTKQTRFTNVVYVGIAAGVFASIVAAFLFTTFAGGFEGRAEEIFEGITMFVGAFLLTTMILWMLGQREVRVQLESSVQKHVEKEYKAGLFLLVFFSVLREGVETVIFLGAAAFVSEGNNLVGSLLGVLCAIVLGYLLFVSTLKISLRHFFSWTSILLILFAAGLVAHGVHEFEEAGIFPPLIEHVWDINPAVLPDGSYPALHEKGALGSVLVGLFGYNGNPSLLEVLSAVAYLGVVGVMWRRINGRTATS